MRYPVVDLHKKKSAVLIILCSDPRFQNAYRKATDGLGKYYDLLVLPGASLAVVDDPNLIKNIKLLQDLHHFETVHILDHIDCGAFGPVDDEIQAHSKMLAGAAAKIRKALPEMIVSPHLLGEKGELTLETKG